MCNQESVQRILTLLDIQSVIYVDDEFSSLSTIEIVSQSTALTNGQLINIFPEIAEFISPDQETDSDIRTSYVEKILDDYSPDEIQRVSNELKLLNNTPLDSDNPREQYENTFCSLFSGNILKKLSPEEWKESQDALIENSSAPKTLFVFDQDFSPANGESNAGIKIIQAITSSSPGILCGLLTNTADLSNWEGVWESLCAQYSLSKDQFILIPKQSLAENQDLLIKSLKYIALSPAFTDLKNKFVEIMRNSVEAAADEVNKFSIFDLDHLIFKAPGDTGEGLWEPDILFRVFNLYHRSEARKLALSGEIESLAQQLRMVSCIPDSSGANPPSKIAYSILRQETYEEGDYINSNNLPIEPGDIFEKTGTASLKKYILLAQPCDLMVRNKGTRQPELEYLPLAEVNTYDPQKHLTVKDNRLLYYDDDIQKEWLINFKRIYFVHSYILDLCVFNNDGISKLILGQECPEGLRPAWKEYHKKCQQKIKNCISNYNIIESIATTRPQKDVLNKMFFQDALFKGKLTKENQNECIEYNCKRVKRLSHTKIFAFLMKYAATLSRPADDFNFGIPTQ